MMKYLVRDALALPVLVTALCLQQVNASSFGVYEPRSFAMGNTGVASANPEQAVFYNPALLGFNEGHERDTRAGRFIFPSTTVVVSQDITEIVDAIDDDLPIVDERITAAINQFNIDPEAGSIELLDSIDEVDRIFDLIGDRTIVIDSFFGGVASEPSDKEGGSFYFGVRGIARGVSRDTEQDQELLDRYRETISFIANGGALSSAPNQDLLVAGSFLSDPAESIISTADISSLILTEAGVAVGKEFEIFGQKISFGVTPKAVYARAFRQRFEYGEENQGIDFQDVVRDFFTLNVDLGVAYKLGDSVRLGLTIKDLDEKRFELNNGLAVTLAPKVRFGSAYELDTMTFAFDFDVVESEPIGDEFTSQEVALGWEWRPNTIWSLRTGYSQDIRSDLDGIFSGGVGARWGRFKTDISFSLSPQIAGFSGQLAVIF